MVGSANLTSDFELTLPYSGTFALLMSAGASPALYTNEVSSFSFLTNTLVLGAVVTNTIFNPGDQLVYTFSGTAGQRLFYDALNGNYLPINVALLSPLGVNVFSGNASADAGPMTLPQTGTYTLVFNASTHTTGGINFVLLDAGAQPVLPLNADFAGSLAGYASAVYQLAGTNGEPLYFQSKTAASGGAYWTLYDPKNSQAGAANIAGDFSLRLPYTGTYVLVLQAAANPLSYSNQVNSFSFATNLLTLGSATTATVTHPGDQVSYNFNGTAGQRVFFDALSVTSFSGTVTLVSPSGLSVFNASPTSDTGPYTLIQSGTYTLTFAGSGHTTGSLSFQLLDIGSQPPLPLNTDMSGNLPANTCLIYQLSGATGEQLFFNSKGVAGGGAYWTLYDLKNSAVAAQSLAGDFAVTLPYAGNYALILSGGAGSVSYTNQVNTFSYTTNPLALGTQTLSAIVHPGDQVFYTFVGTAGQRLYYDSRQTNSASCQASMVSPTGVTLFSVNSAYDQGPFTLTQNGTYTLILSGSGDATGTVSFQLLDLAAAAPISVGSTFADSLDDQTETRVYRFVGTRGQRVQLSSLSASGNQAVWNLWGPTDRGLLLNSYISQSPGTATLPATGTYTVAVIGTGSAGTPVSYQLGVTDVSDASVSASGFGAVNSGTIATGQTNSFAYTAPAGLPVFFDSQDASGQNLVADLIGPDGNAVFTVGETSDSGPYVLPRSGAYTLSVRGYNGTVSGNYSFRLLDLTASPALALNTAVSNALANPYQTDVYQFTSTSGQALIYDALTNDVNYPSVYVQLLDPNGQSIGPAGDFGNDRGPFGVQYTGTCYLLMRNNKPAASTYAFQMLDVASQASLPVNAAVTNTLNVYPLLVYRYAGSAGQSLYFHGLPGDPSGSWILYDPNNTAVSAGSASLGGDFEVTLPANGTYALVLSSSSSSPGPEVFQVSDYAYFTNAYTLGNPVVDAIARPGERHVYTFAGTVGQDLTYDALTNDPPSPNSITVQLLNPEGLPEGPIAGRFSYDRGPFTLQQSGTYSLVFDGSVASVGTFAFRLLDVSALPALPLNVVVSNSLDAYAALTYQLAGTNGEQLYFRGQGVNPSGSWALYDPNNNPVGNTSLGGDFEVTLSTPGTYALILNNYSATSPELFQVNDYAYFTNSYTIGTALVDAISRPGERRAYTFTGTIGQRLIYDALTNDPPYPNAITVQLLNPQGQPEGPINGRFSFDRGPFTLQESGTYTLWVDGSQAGVGPFAFQLLDISAQPDLPFNTAVTNTLDVYSEIVYRHTGLAGEHLYFHGQPGNAGGTWTLYDPNNNYVGASSLGGDFEVVLAMNGTYTLVLGSYSATAAPVVFEVNSFNFGEPVQVNRAPSLSHIPDQITGEGSLLTFTAQATDPGNNALAFSLDPGAPPGASIDPASGAFAWIPPGTGFSLVTNVVVRVTNNGTPSLSAAQSVTIAVVAAPIMITVQKTAGTALVFWRSAIGKHYQLQFKNDLADPNWTSIGGPLAASAFVTSEPDSTLGTEQQRFYHVILLDP